MTETLRGFLQPGSIAGQLRKIVAGELISSGCGGFDMASAAIAGRSGVLLSHQMAQEICDLLDSQAPPSDVAGIVRRWVVVHEPGCVPEVKRPMEESDDGVMTLLRELKAARPAGTFFTLCQLTWNQQLRVQDGDEALRP